ncbi:MAG: methylmalonate-semialdehyde dehydrogenase (CoA acylating) [Bdellovibrionales bacterium CG12_big_fil_rev_8_21_14_0_65_38_15]|nr:MAG: methylmalonate-semialdehyde dehydrogenase (CoA acylating) [Bdellovibrionales bacterium CG22_combo_CG10-13_8_21_14_all_38_13]PIQ53290.1 MAG: methylmalonate-semialdehyde dehydrogenase (CoA acylating) [Bdellovibrionales bacterium CG12_big_fil_rev_8_21_14_0_65_38_15]PIR30348.1 MAG: methylmalonate-semialdehyde dehydrogenase (CoA acylating) [Bdellovibrionales bacterium CG11_big_fil_rev_8_21_14_0_20_38_13]
MQIQLPTETHNCLNFINNAFVSAAGELFPIDSPWSGKKIGESRFSTKGDVDAAVSAASAAQIAWGQTPIKERTKVMFNFRDILLRDLDKLSQIVAAENGKTPIEARAGVMKGVEVLEYAISLQNLDLGGKMEVSRGVHCEYRREALGVIANITPFNFPVMVPMWTIPIALTLGNAYIWKPSEKTPMASQYLASALKEAGLPSGLFQVVQGGKDTVEAIIDHPQVKAVGFVGSTKIAKAVYERSTSLGKRALALGGAKNHIVLLPDANLDLCGAGISDSFTGCAGQRCMAASVILAVGNVDKHIEKVVERAKSQVLGTDMGAIITKEQVTFLKDAIARAEKNGAKILLDGRNTPAPKGMEEGYWLGPTVLDNVKPGSEAASFELFGPIVSIIRCQTIGEAMKIENEVEYGNACSVFTSSGVHAERVIQSAKAGMVGINVGVPVPREPFSFGGINASKFGHGDITGVHSLDFWTNTKKITTKWEPQSDQNWMS